MLELRQAVLVKIQEAMTTTCLQTSLHQVLFRMMRYVISNKLKCSAGFQICRGSDCVWCVTIAHATPPPPSSAVGPGCVTIACTFPLPPPPVGRRSEARTSPPNPPGLRCPPFQQLIDGHPRSDKRVSLSSFSVPQSHWL